MASNRSPDRATWHARRRRIVLFPMMIGLLLFPLAAWRYASRTALAHRAVTTTAVIDDVQHGRSLRQRTGSAPSASTPPSATRSTARSPTAALHSTTAPPSSADPAIREATRSPSPTTHSRSTASTLPAVSSAGIPAGPMVLVLGGHGRDEPRDRGSQHGAGSLISAIDTSVLSPRPKPPCRQPL